MILYLCDMTNIKVGKEQVCSFPTFIFVLFSCRLSKLLFFAFPVRDVLARSTAIVVLLFVIVAVKVGVEALLFLVLEESRTLVCLHLGLHALCQLPWG